MRSMSLSRLTITSFPESFVEYLYKVQAKAMRAL